MLNSSILDIVIGLIFIYLLYSLLATILQEIIASQFSLELKYWKGQYSGCLKMKINLLQNSEACRIYLKKQGMAEQRTR